ncbi:MAG: DUF3500 domain-containing protein, partial [Planctomycetota bacterium]|nr:DUF3500 domain-containing protein [Planctomycetota bacterium]
MHPQSRSWIAFGLLALVSAAAGWNTRPSPASDMTIAASAFLASLSPELRDQGALAFDSPARTDWHYIPRDRSGVSFAKMNAEQRTAARNLIRSALSSQGSNKVEQIMLLETVLIEIEHGTGPKRDPMAYCMTVFGTPGPNPWGWKIEGHHLSLNFTGRGELIAVTPSFLGANPGQVKQGDRAGVRVLAVEEDLGRALLASLTPEQRTQAIVADTAPSDVLAVPGRELDKVDASGLAVSTMDASQRELVEQLLREYAGNLRHDLASQELARIHAAGIDAIRF